MNVDEYSEIAREKWNQWINEKGIYMFAVRSDIDEFIQHGKEEAEIFLEPEKAKTVKPKGNDPKWPGEFVDSRSIEDLIGKPLSECTMLEFGCGGARLLVPFAKRFKSVYGYDISDEALANARTIMSLQEDCPSNIILFNGPNIFADNIIQENSLDFIFSYIVIQHISNNDTIRKSFEDFSKALKLNGIGRIHVWTKVNGYSEDNCFNAIGMDVETYMGICESNGLDLIEAAGDGLDECHFLTFRKRAQ